MNAMMKLLALAILPVALYAQTSVAPSGSGTATSPYVIESLSNLYWLSQTSSVWGSTFVQTKDIDASETKGWNDSLGFSPIGDGITAFKGIYHGREYVWIRGGQAVFHAP